MLIHRPTCHRLVLLNLTLKYMLLHPNLNHVLMYRVCLQHINNVSFQQYFNVINFLGGEGITLTVHLHMHMLM